MGFVFFLIGLIVASFTLIQTLIIIVFGIPTTKKLERVKILIEDNGIIKRYFLTIAILLSLFLGALLIIFFASENGYIGFLVGSATALLFGVGKVGKNASNVADYLQINMRYLAVVPEEALFAIIHS